MPIRPHIWWRLFQRGTGGSGHLTPAWHGAVGGKLDYSQSSRPSPSPLYHPRTTQPLGHPLPRVPWPKPKLACQIP